MRTCIIAACMLACTAAASQTAGNLSRILKRISAINEVQYQYIGPGGTESDNYRNYLALEKKATTEQLVRLTDDRNPVIAAYAGWALIARRYAGLPRILDKFIRNDREAETFNACMQGADPLSGIFYFRYLAGVEDSLKESDAVLQQLDSIILYADKVYDLLPGVAFGNRVYPQSFNPRICTLAFQQQDTRALFYLCSWYKADHKAAIKAALAGYLQRTDFKDAGNFSYYRAVSELLRYNTDDTKDIVIAKLKADRHWQQDRQMFQMLLAHYDIYDAQLK